MVVIRVLLFYTLLFLNIFPFAIVSYYLIKFHAINNSINFGDFIIASFAYLICFYNIGVSGILIPIYGIKIQEKNHWSSRFLLLLFFLGTIMFLSIPFILGD